MISSINTTTIKCYKRQYLHFHRLYLNCVFSSLPFLLFVFSLLDFQFFIIWTAMARVQVVCVNIGSVDFVRQLPLSTVFNISIDTKRYLLITVLQQNQSIRMELRKKKTRCRQHWERTTTTTTTTTENKKNVCCIVQVLRAVLERLKARELLWPLFLSSLLQRIEFLMQSTLERDVWSCKSKHVGCNSWVRLQYIFNSSRMQITTMFSYFECNFLCGAFFLCPFLPDFSRPYKHNE